MLKENDVAPDFTLPTHEGSTLRLSELRGRRVVLFFYPRADTPGCTTEACEFRDQNEEFDSRDAVILGISPDSIDEVRAFREKYHLPYPLLADAEHQVAEQYGVWVEKSMFGRKFWGVERTTFVIGADGRIEQIYRKVKPSGHAMQVLEQL